MSTENIICPECHAKISLSKVLTGEIETALKAKSETALKEKEETLRAELDAERREAEASLKKDKLTMESKIRKEIEFQNSVELQDLQADLEKKNQALQEANEKELKFRQEKRDLEEREKNLILEVDRTIEAEREKISAKALKDADEEHRLRDAEKDKKIADALAQVEEMKRKMQQGSQQAQGDILEVELEEFLKREFPTDEIEPVSTGIKGGDILQRVKTKSGKDCGLILWETKRTKSFSEGWISKLKSDGRNCKASICLLATEALPEGVETFAQMDGVWVTSLKTSVPLAHALRFSLIEVAGEKSLQVGRKEKSEIVFEYLTGPEFKGRVEAILESYNSMLEDLEAEKRAMEKIWSKREKQIRCVTKNLAGMHGDIQGIAGNSLPTIKLLELEN